MTENTPSAPSLHEVNAMFRADPSGPADELSLASTPSSAPIFDGLVRVGQSSGEVSVVAGWTPDDGFDVSQDDAARYAATLSGELRCD